jgi:hypothetical protein
LEEFSLTFLAYKICLVEGYEVRVSCMPRPSAPSQPPVAPLQPNELYAPVELLNATGESFETGREVALKGY